MFSFAGRLLGITQDTPVTSPQDVGIDFDDKDCEQLLDDSSSRSEADAKNLGGDYVGIPPKKKQARFSCVDSENAEVKVTYIESNIKASEGRVLGFQFVSVHEEAEEKDDFIAIDIGVASKKAKETKEEKEEKAPAVIELAFLNKLATVNDLLLNTNHYVATNCKNASELRQACMQAIAEALYKVTGVYFSVYWTPTGFDLRTYPIDVKNERRHFAFMDSFLQMKTPFSFKRKAVGGGKFQYIIDKINVSILVDLVKSREASLMEDAKGVANARLQYQLLKKYFELNPATESKRPVSLADTLIVSEASASRSYPHLRTRFCTPVQAEKQAVELAKLEAICKEKLLASSKDVMMLNECFVKLCLKLAVTEEPSASANKLLRDFNFDTELAAYFVKLAVVRQKPVNEEAELTVIRNNAAKMLELYEEIEAQHIDADKERILKTTIAVMFEDQYNFFCLDVKSQPDIDWKATSGSTYETRTVTGVETSLQQNIIAIQHHDSFVAAMAEIEPRLVPLISGSEPLPVEEMPLVPIYEQGQLYHRDSSASAAAKVYPLREVNHLDSAIKTGVFHLMKQKNKIKLLTTVEEKVVIASSSATDLYQELLTKEAKSLAEHKISLQELEQSKDVIEAVIDHAIDIFDEIAENKMIQHHQVAFLAACQVLFGHCTEAFNASIIQEIVKQFDLTKPVADDYVVEFSPFSSRLKPTASSTSAVVVSLTQAAPESKRTEKTIEPIKAAIMKELLEKLEQFKQSWSTVKNAPIPQRLLANLVASSKANVAASPAFLVSLLVVNLKCLEVVSDKLGCHDELADILRSTLARFEAEIIKGEREKQFSIIVSDGLSGSFVESPVPVTREAAPYVPVIVDPSTVTSSVPEEKRRAPALYDKLVSAPHFEPKIYDIDFVEDLKKILAECGEDTAVYMDQDCTLICQHTGEVPFKNYISDFYLQAGKYDQVITQYHELKAVLANIADADKGIVSHNLNMARARFVASVVTIDKDRAFAFPNKLLNCRLLHDMTEEKARFELQEMLHYAGGGSIWGHREEGDGLLQVTEQKEDKHGDGMKSLAAVTGLTLDQLKLIRSTYDTMDQKLGPGKNFHLAFQIMASNLQRHKQAKPFLKNVVVVDDDVSNITLANKGLSAFLSVLADLEGLKEVPGIATLKAIKVHTILPKLELRVDPSLAAQMPSAGAASASGMFAPAAAAVAPTRPKSGGRYRFR